VGIFEDMKEVLGGPALAAGSIFFERRVAVGRGSGGDF
jgi:hypothetical protein